MYRVRIGQKYIQFEFLFQSMEEASVFIESCLKNTEEKNFSCEIELVKECEDEDNDD